MRRAAWPGLSRALVLTLLTWALAPPSAAAFQAVNRSPPHPSARAAEQSFNLALKLERAGSIEQATAIYEQLVTDFPANPRYYQRLKRVLRSSARYDDLRRVINARLHRQPDDLQSQVELGDVFLLLGRKSAALRTWESLLVRFPQNATAQRLVLTHLLTSNLTEEAVGLLARLRVEKGDAAFFSLDMGRLYAARLAYDLATTEFLRYLSAQPQAVGNVMNQLLRFPSEPEVIAMLRAQLTNHGSAGALRILAAMEFKNRNFARAVELHQQLETPGRQRVKLALDLVAEGEWDLAESVLNGLLAEPEAVAFYEEAILALAGIYQARSREHRVALPLSGFYQDNRFFDLPYMGVTEESTGALRQAIVLYDSLATTRHNSLARLRLGDIKFLILDDFDGAIADYEAVLGERFAAKYYSQTLLRLIDVWMAKGDLQAAEQVRQRAATRLISKEQANLLDVKAVELIFLSGDRDSLLAYLGGELAALGPADPAFNDLMELSGLVRRFQGSPEPYQAFVRSEALLRQNRRSEAVAVLSAALEGQLSQLIAPVLQYRLATLLALQGKHGAAERLSLNLPGETEFTELGLLLAAELADYLAADSDRAAERYLTFVDTYPLSIYADAARLRYRELRPGEE